MTRILQVLAVVISILVVFILVYSYTYSMETAEGFEVNDSGMEEKLLIATQGSEFKDFLVLEIVETIKERPIYIKVIDVTELAGVDEDDWNGILIIHTWEKWEPQPDALAFIKRAKKLEDICTVSTSGSGEEVIFGVDGISGASEISSISKIALEIVDWLEMRFKVLDDNITIHWKRVTDMNETISPLMQDAELHFEHHL